MVAKTALIVGSVKHYWVDFQKEVRGRPYSAHASRGGGGSSNVCSVIAIFGNNDIILRAGWKARKTACELHSTSVIRVTRNSLN